MKIKGYLKFQLEDWKIFHLISSLKGRFTRKYDAMPIVSVTVVTVVTVVFEPMLLFLTPS